METGHEFSIPLLRHLINNVIYFLMLNVCVYMSYFVKIRAYALFLLLCVHLMWVVGILFMILDFKELNIFKEILTLKNSRHHRATVQNISFVA